MVKRCVAGGCSNTASADVSLHYFPVDEDTRSAWTSAVKLTRDGWAGPTKHSVLCSEHFPAECFEQQTSEFAREMMSEMGITYRRRTSLKADAVPVLFVQRSPDNELSQAFAKRIQARQDATRNAGSSLEREYLTTSGTPTPDKDKTSRLNSVPVNPKPSVASDSSMSANSQILQNIENSCINEKSALLQVTNTGRYVVNEKQLLRLFCSQCPLCQSTVKMETAVCGVLFILNLQCPQCDYSKQWKSLNHMSIPAAADTQTGCTKTTLETDSDGVPELVYFVGEESDPVEFSDDSSDPGDMDSGEDWDPENELYLDEKLQTDSDEEASDGEDVVPEHGELCTDCGTFLKKKKPHTCEHKIKPLPCNICGKRFANELALALHTRIHSTDYEFSCRYCHVKFKTRFNKTAHEQVHLTEEKPYKCPKCSETFARYPEYKTHLEGHGGLTQLKCHFCGVEFSNSFHLQRHLVVHAVEKPYKCPVCERGFTQAGNLKVHMRLHTGEKPFRCQHCDQIFSHNVSLKSHVKRYHTPSSANQQKTNKRKRDSGDSRDNGNMEVADSLLFEAEQETDDVQSKQKSRGKTNRKNTVRSKGRPKRKTAGSLRKKQGSDTNTAKSNIL